jgi:hypothetical protein
MKFYRFILEIKEKISNQNKNYIKRITLFNDRPKTKTKIKTDNNKYFNTAH